MDVRLACAGFPRLVGDCFKAIRAAGAEEEIAMLRAESAGRRRAESTGRTPVINTHLPASENDMLHH